MRKPFQRKGGICRASARRGKWYEHLRSMIPTGIAAYTAYTVFGARRLAPEFYQTSYYWIFWVLPLLIGIPAIRLTIWYYRKKFGESNGKANRGGASPGQLPKSLTAWTAAAA